jgi:hypothetical protein
MVSFMFPSFPVHCWTTKTLDSSTIPAVCIAPFYFVAHDPAAPLVSILLCVRYCVAQTYYILQYNCNKGEKPDFFPLPLFLQYAPTRSMVLYECPILLVVAYCRTVALPRMLPNMEPFLHTRRRRRRRREQVVLAVFQFGCE